MAPERIGHGLALSRSTASRRITDGTIQPVKFGNRHT